MPAPEYYYRTFRIDDLEMMALYEDGPLIRNTPRYWTSSYPVIKRTPCGVWINTCVDTPKKPKRFILNRARKKFAHPTEREAILAFKARKNKQRRHLLNELREVNRQIALTLEADLLEANNS